MSILKKLPNHFWDLSRESLILDKYFPKAVKESPRGFIKMQIPTHGPLLSSFWISRNGAMSFLSGVLVIIMNPKVWEALIDHLLYSEDFYVRPSPSDWILHLLRSWTFRLIDIYITLLLRGRYTAFTVSDRVVSSIYLKKRNLLEHQVSSYQIWQTNGKCQPLWHVTTVIMIMMMC